MTHKLWNFVAAAVVSVHCSTLADAADIKVLSAGAMKSVVVALTPEFEKKTGHRLIVDSGTAGGLLKRVNDGEAVDVAIITPGAIDDLTAKGKIATGSKLAVAKVGIGVGIKEGARAPDIGTVEAFKRTLLAAKSVTYVDPKAGGSSGIYFDRLLETMGIADAVRAKAILKPGGYVAELVATGEAELAVHQISEILPVKGVVLAGPLPADVQNYTIYAAGVGATAKEPAAAKLLMELLASDAASAVLKAKGMERP